MLMFHLTRCVTLSEVIFSPSGNFPWGISAVHKPSFSVRFFGMGMNIIMTLAAQGHKVLQPEGNLRVSCPSHAPDLAVMYVHSRSQASLAGLLVTLQSPPASLPPGQFASALI